MTVGVVQLLMGVGEQPLQVYTANSLLVSFISIAVNFTIKSTLGFAVTYMVGNTVIMIGIYRLSFSDLKCTNGRHPKLPTCRVLECAVYF